MPQESRFNSHALFYNMIKKYKIINHWIEDNLFGQRLNAQHRSIKTYFIKYIFIFQIWVENNVNQVYQHHIRIQSFKNKKNNVEPFKICCKAKREMLKWIMFICVVLLFLYIFLFLVPICSLFIPTHFSYTHTHIFVWCHWLSQFW